MRRLTISILAVVSLIVSLAGHGRTFGQGTPTTPTRGARAMSADAGAQTSAWSAPVNGLRARLTTSAGTTHGGVRVPRVDLELENVSDVANPIELYWDIDALLAFRIEDASGVIIAPASVPASILRPTRFWLMVPYHGRVRLEITTFGYGIARGLRMFIGLPGMGAWAVAPGDTRRYMVSGTLTASPHTEPNRRPWQGRLNLQEVEIR